MKSEAGFTLIEALVALVVLAFAGVSIIGATEAHVRRIADLEARAAAQWVAENRMAELTIAGGRPTDETLVVSMLGAAWTVQQTITPSSDPDLAEVTIAVGEPDRSSYLVSYTGFLDTGERQ